jgi:uncharacterized protein (TIGR02271 family)
LDTTELEAMTTEELRERAKSSGVPGAKKLGREELVELLTGTDDAMTRSEERLTVDTEREQVGAGQIRKYVVTEEASVTVPVHREELRLEREPITEENRAAAESGLEISEADYEVRLYEEHPVVGTETVPVERVRLTKDVHTEERTVTGEVRKERIEVTMPGEESRELD